MIPQGSYKQIHGFNWYGKGSQEVLIKNANDSERIVKIVERHSHRWAVVKEADVVALAHKTNTFLCEILHRYPKKVYFDLDIKKEENEDYFNKFDIKEIITLLQEQFDCPNIAVSGSEEPEKKSYHITVPNCILQNDEDQLKLKYMVKELKEDGYLAFDDKVYTKNRAMKCINQRKDPKRLPQTILQNNEPKDHFICSYINADVSVFDYEPDPETVRNKYDGSYLQKVKRNNEIVYTPLHIDYSTVKVCDLNEPSILLGLTPYPINQPHAYTWRVFLFCVYNGITFDTFWQWASTKDNTDIRFNKWRKYWDDEVAKKLNEKYKIGIKGYINFLGNFYPDLMNTNTLNDVYTNKFRTMFNLPNVKKIGDSLEVKNVFDIKRSSGRIEMKHFNVPQKALLFNIGMGGGKTTTTIQWLKESMNPFIWITPRIALAKNTQGAITKQGIDGVVNYKDFKPKDKYEGINKARSIIIQAESLHYLENNKDVVVIDEIETVLNTWNSMTHGEKLDKNFKTFCRVLKGAKKIILLDAFITKKTIKFLHNIGIDDYIVYESSVYKTARKRIDFVEGEKGKDLQMIDQIASEINAGKKIYLFYPFKTDSNYALGIRGIKALLEKMCPDKKFSEPHTGDSSAKQKEKLTDANTYWSQYDCVLVNGAITVGVNFDIPDYFDKIYMFVSSYVNPMPRDIIQASMRIRQVKDSELVMYCFSQDNKKAFECGDYYHTASKEYKDIIDGIMVEYMADWFDSLRKFCELANYDIGDKARKIEEKANLDNLNLALTDKNKTEYLYNDIEELKEDDFERIREKVETDEFNMESALKLKRYFFDKKYKHLDSEARQYIWDENAEYTFDNLRTDIIQCICEDNAVDSLVDLKLTKSVELKQTTIDKMRNDYNCISRGNIGKVVGCVNTALRRQAISSRTDKSKNVKYTLSKKINTLYDYYDTMTDIMKQKKIDSEKCVL